MIGQFPSKQWSTTTLDRGLSMLAGQPEGALAKQEGVDAKARYLKVDKLKFYDLFAPVGGSAKKWTYQDVSSYVERQ